jgi:electron transport complex protein RnfG
MATLATAGALAGLAIVAVYGWTQPAIRAHKARMVALAVANVLRAPASWDTLYLHDGRLTGALPAGSSPDDLEMVFRGYDADGLTTGYAIAAGEPGFQDIVRLMFGYDPVRGVILGMQVLESKETPGLGDKIEKDEAFVTQFDGARTPLIGVKPRDATGADQEIDMITGATISSKTVIKVINNAIARLTPAFEAGVEESVP